MSGVENALNDFGEQLVGSLKSSLQTVKPDAATLADNIQFNVQSTANGLNLELSLPGYYKWVDEGRKPGKFPPPQVIADWVNARRIQLSPKNIQAPKSKPLSLQAQTKSLAYLIGRKIAAKGIPATNFYSNVINEDTINQLKETLSEALKQDCLNQITI